MIRSRPRDPLSSCFSVLGAKDKQLTGAATKLELALTKKKIAHDIKEYPNTGHAFMNLHQAGGPVFGTLLKISGAKPNPDASADAWSRIEKFFGEHLSTVSKGKLFEIHMPERL